jgi:hypothetical protein
MVLPTPAYEIRVFPAVAFLGTMSKYCKWNKISQGYERLLRPGARPVS